MIAANYPLVGIVRTGNSDDDVVEPLRIPIGLHFQMNFGRTGAYVIGVGQGATPLLGSDGSFQRRQQRLRVAIGNWQHGDLGQRLSIFQCQPFRVGSRTDARG